MSSASAAGSAAKDRAARRMSGPGSVAHAQFVRRGAVCAGGAAVEAGRETHRKWRVRTPATLACHKPLIDRKSVWCLIPVQFVYEIGIGCVRLSQRFRVVLCFSGGDGIPVSLISLSRDGPTRSQQSERHLCGEAFSPRDTSSPSQSRQHRCWSTGNANRRAGARQSGRERCRRPGALQTPRAGRASVSTRDS